MMRLALIMSYIRCMTVQEIEDAGTAFERAVAAEIRAEMARQRVSNRQLAMKMGKTPFWVGDRLRGKNRLEVAALQMFADALDVKVADLVDVRHQGLEPRTRCLRASGQDPLPILVAVPDLPDESTPSTSPLRAA